MNHILTNNQSKHHFHTKILINDQLLALINCVKTYKHRNCYNKLSAYLFKTQTNKVLILYGLKNTGKTTLMYQVLLDMTNEQLNKTAFIQVKPNDNLPKLYSDLQYLQENQYKYIFIDEVTLLEDFIEGSAIISDIF